MVIMIKTMLTSFC